ncbi:MAG: prolyl oligopeptidase family serine peptidase [Bacteroidota bacterium]|uniref:alpha/beta hydrolase family esterase n=1 Tax=Runella sp. TaxID=1960881 RepID=UPI0030161234
MMNLKYLFGCLVVCTILTSACKKTDNTPDLVEAGKQTDRLVINDRQREFVTYIPENVNVTESLPLVFVFHNTGSTGDAFLTSSGWQAKADAEHFILVCPTAWKYSCFAEYGSPKNNITKWNDDNVSLCPGATDTLSNDVLFVRNMITYLLGQYPIDNKRIYATGFAGGGNLCAKLATDAPNLFAAIAASAGTSQDTTRAPSEVIPFMQTYGALDESAVMGGPLPTDESVLSHPFVAPIINRTLKKMHLNTTHTYTESAQTGTAVYKQSNGSQSAEYQFVVVKDLAHAYADGKNNAVAYTGLVWDFFKRFKR